MRYFIPFQRVVWEVFMKRKLLAFLLSCFFLIGLLTACGNTDREDNVLRVWYCDNGSNVWTQLSVLLQEYDEKIPEKIELSSFDSEESLSDALSNHADVPSLVFCRCNMLVPLLDRGMLPYTDKVFKPGNYPEWPSKYIEACSVNGRLFAVPLWADTCLLTVNTDLLNGTGILTENLTTLEGLCQSAAQYSSDKSGIFFTTEHFSDLFRISLRSLGSGFTAVRDNDKKDSNFVRIYNLIASAAFAGGITAMDGTDFDLLASGQIACTLVMGDELVRKEEQLHGISAAVLPYPSVKGSQPMYTQELYGVAVLDQNLANQETCGELLDWLFLQQETLTKATGYTAVYQSSESERTAGSTSPPLDGNKPEPSEMEKSVKDAIASMQDSEIACFFQYDADYAANAASFEKSFREALVSLYS